ncbi:MAG TPA: hypothetical protein VFZ14_11870 [Burkholderiales bacterium]|nr:hypothetical protein [Burkholderiales bacterium]
MNKESKTAIGLVVLSNLAMVDAFVAMQPALSEEQSRQLLASLDKVKALNQDLMKLAGYTTPPAK